MTQLNFVYIVTNFKHLSSLFPKLTTKFEDIRRNLQECLLNKKRALNGYQEWKGVHHILVTAPFCGWRGGVLHVRGELKEKLLFLHLLISADQDGRVENNGEMAALILGVQMFQYSTEWMRRKQVCPQHGQGSGMRPEAQGKKEKHKQHPNPSDQVDLVHIRHHPWNASYIAEAWALFNCGEKKDQRRFGPILCHLSLYYP